ncbi:hypothetical protein GOP47_0010311 [Adiantum capillus-veneris]|uniref:Ubiquitin-like protease family profile domain-containing protein n=1 Tax=Adiantum capillus-veneris TaxID=13818 RepID=A0A9D4ZIM3_ADICA|nr:hypothetical protein GOP47_0010311 [Adiantum capillus-veneris]
MNYTNIALLTKNCASQVQDYQFLSLLTQTRSKKQGCRGLTLLLKSAIGVQRLHQRCRSIVSNFKEITSKYFYNKMVNRESAILLFDSLSIVCMERLLPHVSRVLTHFSKHCSNLQVKEELEDPRQACKLVTAQCPQQPNSTVCGYYVMTAMRLLIKTTLKDQKPQGNLLKKKWFAHEEVEFTRQKLNAWLNKALGEVTLG